MRMFDASQTAKRLPYGLLAEAAADVLLAARDGRANAPERMRLPLPNGGVLLVMPAADASMAIAKLVTVHPGNPASGRAAIQGEVLAMEAATGVRLGLLDGATVTARRTAAVSLLAARHLAPNPFGPLLCVGAGVQAEAHCQAFFEAFGVKTFFISSRSRRRAEGLAERLREFGADARAVDAPDAVLAETPLVITATSSRRPVLPDAVRSDAFIAAVGAFTPEMAELPPELVLRAAVYVDTMEGAMSEAGDLIQARIDWNRVTPLVRALDGPPPAEGPALFKSVGSALFDLAAARLAFAGEASGA